MLRISSAVSAVVEVTSVQPTSEKRTWRQLGGSAGAARAASAPESARSAKSASAAPARLTRAVEERHDGPAIRNFERAFSELLPALNLYL